MTLPSVIQHRLKAIQQWFLHGKDLARVALVLALLGVLVAVFSLAAAAGNNQAWAQHYNALLWANIAIILALLVLVLALLSRLLIRLKKARFGARLTLKFAGAFAVLGFVPGLLVYLVSVLFLSQSIDTWFNVKVDKALDAGLELSRSAIQAQLQTLTQKARTAAASIDAALPLGPQAQQIRAQFGDVDVLVFNANSQVLASTGSLLNKGLLTDTPSSKDLLILYKTGVFSSVEAVPSAEGAEQERLNLRVALQLPKASPAPNAMGALPTTADVAEAVIAGGTGSAAEQGNTPLPLGLRQRVNKSPLFLQLSQAVSPQVSQWAQTVAQGNKDYEALALGRTGIRKIYGATLTITMLLCVLAAIAAGFVLADAMSAPLLRLARGMQSVAGGDFSLLQEPRGKDDLAVLTRSFNRMLTELDGARSELTQSNTYLAQVLTSLSTGVLVIDAQHCLRSINPSAQALLGIATVEINRSAQAQLPETVWQCINSKFDKNNWQQQLELTVAGHEVKTLLLRGARLQQSDGEGVLLVFDDVSDVMLAQKAQAWSEVARRLAHEIKNPLTPIQLSAERLTMKLGDKLTGADADLLKRGTGTIIAQVTALKNMVDEFRQYARLPQAQLEPMHVHPLLGDVLQMYKGRVQVALQASNDRVLADADQLRQIVHNLLGNALDAASIQSAPRVDLVTRDHAQGFCVEITDNGAGFSQEALAKLFEPYHTTKAQGTGLGLAIVHRIVQDHGAKIRVKNRVDDNTGKAIGASVEIVFGSISQTAAAIVAAA